LEPDIVMNMAAFHRVDDCEDNPEKAFQVNTIAVADLARICRDLGATLLHMSTDYVFGGDLNWRRPYTEANLPWPVNVYGVSKLSGEYFVKSLCPKHLIVRTSGLYGTTGSGSKGGNFVELMLRLAREGRPIKVVNDQCLAPTYTVDLATRIVDLVAGGHCGLYHIANAGSCTWYEFATTIFELAGQSPQLSATTTEALAARANRPRYSVLASQQLNNIGLADLRSWPEALAAYMSARARHLTD
jgi:dTDP-4-dehydrorhamnose reductase